MYNLKHIYTHKTNTRDPISLHKLITFVQKAANWVSQDVKNNVIAVQCRHGKGRAGLAACAWLIYSGYCETAEEALQIYTGKRIGKKKSVEKAIPVPSQRR